MPHSFRRLVFLLLYSSSFSKGSGEAKGVISDRVPISFKFNAPVLIGSRCGKQRVSLSGEEIG